MIALGVVLCPTLAHTQESRLYLMTSGSKDEVKALESSLRYFRSQVTKNSQLVFTADKDIDTVMATCRESIGVSQTEDRACRLEASRRVGVEQVLEITASKVDKTQWELWIRALDPEGNMVFEDGVVAEGKQLSAAARSGLPLLASKYLCGARGMASACGGVRPLTTSSNPQTPSISSIPTVAPGPTGGRLEILDVTPSPVTVLVNGREIGLAPGQFRDLPLGAVEVTLRATGYTDVTRQVTLGDTMGALNGVRLDALPALLQVWCNVEGAEIRVDGRNRGTTLGDADVTLELSAGAVEVEIVRQGYGTLEERVELVAGGTRRLEARLEVRTGPAPLAGYAIIKAGSFSMGSPSGEADRSTDEQQHNVTISRDFYVKATEVTQGEWRALMGNNPSNFSSCGDSCPVETVSLYDALAYCNALSRSEGVEQCYDLSGCSGTPGTEGYSCSDSLGVSLRCKGYRLPTESEWEYAARAGSTTRYAGGDSESALASMGWYGGNAGDKTHPAKQKSANAWGLYDMHGNVWEWAWDWYGDYPGTTTDPVGASTGSGRVVRGGGWGGYAKVCRAAFRNFSSPGNRSVNLGFRPVRSSD